MSPQRPNKSLISRGTSHQMRACSGLTCIFFPGNHSASIIVFFSRFIQVVLLPFLIVSRAISEFKLSRVKWRPCKAGTRWPRTPACHLRARTGPPPAMSGCSRRTSCSAHACLLTIRRGFSFTDARLRSQARLVPHSWAEQARGTRLIVWMHDWARRSCHCRDRSVAARGRRRTECRIRRQRSRSVPSIVDPHVIAPTCFLPHRVRGAHAQVWACVCGRSAHAKSIIPVKIDTAGATCPFWPT